MGTRADFYVGRGLEAEWLGSIAFDGYPDGTPEPILDATTEAGWRLQVAVLIDGESSGTKPEQGWPWSWDDSRTTDYAYAFDDGKVWASGFGCEWFDPLVVEDEDRPHVQVAVFPNMAERKNVTFGDRSGLLVIGPQGPIENLP